MTCPNCETPIGDRFCPHCGQDRTALDLSMGPWIRHAIDEVLGVDGTLWRTLQVLFTQPGQLTLEWAAGRRARYVSPLRLYMFTALLFFTAGALLPGSANLLADVVRGFAEGSLQAGRWEAYADELDTALPRLMIVLVPFSALLCYAAFHRKGRYFAEFMVFALHFHVFYFLPRAAAYLLPAEIEEHMATALLVALWVYVALAARRAFGGSAASSTIRAAGVLVGYGLTISVTAIAIGVFYVRPWLQ